MAEQEIKQTYQSPRWTGEIADCSFPVTFDTYSRCSFGCLYCFSAFQKTLHRGCAEANYYEKPVMCVNVEHVKKVFTGEVKSQFWPWIEQKRPIQWGGLADQFDLYEKKYGKTLELLEFFDSIDYPISFSTKSAWVFHDERYLRHFKNQGRNWHIKFSIITLNDEKARRIERGVPSPRERLEAMRIASQCGCATTLRLRPYIIGVSDNGLEDLIAKAAAAGAYSVSTEALCLELRAVCNSQNSQVRDAFAKISDEAGFDIVKYYREHSHGGGYLRLTPKEKAPIFERIHRLCDRHGLAFFCSDACGKAQSEHGCCCGAPPEFNFSRGNFSAALQIARKKGQVRFCDIAKDMDALSRTRWNRAEGYNTGCARNRAKFSEFSLKDYLRYLWNNPNAGQSPGKMFSDFLTPAGVDENGDIIYTRSRYE
jgi:DNA repair photolyase